MQYWCQAPQAPDTALASATAPGRKRTAAALRRA